MQRMRLEKLANLRINTVFEKKSIGKSHQVFLLCYQILLNPYAPYVLAPYARTRLPAIMPIYFTNFCKAQPFIE